MDARDYDRMADLLAQMLNKYRNQPFKDDMLKRSVIEHLVVLLQLNDECAKLDDKGWL
jgi:rRNA pseudouridine-1189 N-methylase Emg1 (Nep1/Mra1 family)